MSIKYLIVCLLKDENDDDAVGPGWRDEAEDVTGASLS